MQAMGTQCKLVCISYSLIANYIRIRKNQPVLSLNELNGLLNEAAGSFDLVRTHD